MGGLVQHELYKIVSNKFVIAVILLFIPFYIGLSYMDYYWHAKLSWENILLFPYEIGTVYEGTVILLALAGVFSQEHTFNTNALILSTKHGRMKLTTAKILAAIVFLTNVVLGAWLVNVVVNVLMAGGTGWSLPIQELEGYSGSTYLLNVWRYMIVQIGTNWFGCIVFGVFILCLSSVNRTILLTFFIGGISLLLPFLIRNFSDFSFSWVLKNLLFTETMRVVNLFNRQRFLEILDIEIQLIIWFFYLYSCLIGIVLVFVIYRVANKRI